MKNTVFTVIAVLLLLATAQFAVGVPTYEFGPEAEITIYNDGDKKILVSQAEVQKVGNKSVWVTDGWWPIEPGESQGFFRQWYAVGPLYFRFLEVVHSTHLIEDTPTARTYEDRAREIIPAHGRGFYARDSQATGFTGKWKDSVSLLAPWGGTYPPYRASADNALVTFDYTNFPLGVSARSSADWEDGHFSNPPHPPELDSMLFVEHWSTKMDWDEFTQTTTYIDVDVDKWKSEGLIRNNPRNAKYPRKRWTNEMLDTLRLERGTYHRYPFRDIRLGGNKPVPVTIDGLEIPSTIRTPALGGNAFIIFEQYGNTCGPTSLEMVLHYYKKRVTMKEIWWAGDIDSVEYGTWPGEMRQALNELGVPAHLYDADTEGYRNDPFERLRSYVDGNRPPCILIRYDDRNDTARYHWVVVVGYHYDSDAGIDEYLIADPHGKFRWENRFQLNKVWSFEGDESFGYWQGGFDPDSKAYWTHLAVDLAADPYTAIVPRNGATSHYPGYWTEMRFKKIEGTREWWGGKRDWDVTFSFNYSFDFYTVSEIRLNHWGAAGYVKSSRRVDDDKVELWGRIEDGKWKRGELDVMVRTFRKERVPSNKPKIDPSGITAEIIGAPAQVVATRLLPNYPNPFNPETWIPYQLSAPADVAVSIYAVDGQLVRRLDLGQMPSGVYRSRARAAYWDGQNAQGEPVASGVYFYTFTAGDFKATRKMVIRK